MDLKKGAQIKPINSFFVLSLGAMFVVIVFTLNIRNKMQYVMLVYFNHGRKK